MIIVSMSVAEIRFQLDEHLHNVIAIQLRRRGLDVLTAHEAGLRGATDSDHLRTALTNGRVFGTVDADFPALVASGIDHAGIAYFPGKARNVGEFVNALVLVHGVYSAEEMVGRIEYL
jgi:hypothetical protein